MGMISNKEFKKFRKENTGLFGKLYNKYILNGKTREQKEDLEQIMYLGFCNAYKTFKESKGVNFKTYAYTCMRNQLLNALTSNYDSIIRLPNVAGCVRNKVCKALTLKNELTQEDKEQISKQVFGSSVVMVNNIIEFIDKQIDYTKPLTLSNDKGDEMEIYGRDDRDKLNSSIDRDFNRNRLLKVLNRTKSLDKNKAIVIKRYGLDGSKPMSFAEIAQWSGRSEQSVRAICTQTVNSMKAVLKRGYNG